MKDEYYKGMLFENQIPEVITKGCTVDAEGMALIQERADFSAYPILPTKYPFQKTVRIYTVVMAFISKSRRNKKMMGILLREGELTFSVFNCHMQGEAEHLPTLKLVESRGQVPRSLVAALVTNTDSSYKNTFNEIQVDRRIEPVSTDDYVSMALKYLFRKGTAEVKEFNSAEVIKRHMIEKEGILWNKNRTVAGLECTHTN